MKNRAEYIRFASLGQAHPSRGSKGNTTLIGMVEEILQNRSSSENAVKEDDRISSESSSRVSSPGDKMAHAFLDRLPATQVICRACPILELEITKMKLVCDSETQIYGAPRLNREG